MDFRGGNLSSAMFPFSSLNRSPGETTMVHATARLIDTLSSRPAPAAKAPATPAPRTSSRLANAIVVKAADPTPAPTTKRQSRSAVPVPVAAPPTRKVVRIRRDPAVAAAELETQRLAGIEAKRVAEETARQTAVAEATARAAREAEATRVRLADEARKAAEAAELEQQNAALREARSELVAFIRRMNDAVFPYAWDGTRGRDWFVQNSANADLAWISSVREGLEAAIVRYKEIEAPRLQALALLRTERGELAKLFEGADLKALDSIWGRGHTIRIFVEWAWTLDLEQVRSVRATLEAGIKSYAEAKAKADADAKAAALVKAKIDPKSPHFDMRAYLAANAAKPAESVCSRPSKAELAALDGKLNGAGPEKKGPVYVNIPGRTLVDRIASLNPARVGMMHSKKPVPHTWPTIDRLLNAVRGAKEKVGGQMVDDGKALGRIETFVAWCEQG